MAEYHDVVFAVTLSVSDEEENPGESDIEDVLYRHLPMIATPDAVYVERMPV